MQMKYEMKKDENNQLSIRELAILDKKDEQVYTLLCEERYDETAVKSSIEKGKDALITVLRTHNLYPQDVYISKIADAVMDLYGKGNKDFDEIIVDDYDFLTKAIKQKEEEKLLEEIDEDIDDESIGIDDLLDDDDVIQNIKTTIQVADDDSVDLEKDNSIDDLLD